MIWFNIENKHLDIICLEKRLRQLIILEEYEKAVRVRRWIDELALIHHGIAPEQLIKFTVT
jgi:protein-arginine kinase activator protein McsA